MPYTRNAAGAWTISAEAGSVAAVPTRLVIIDKQVDPDGTFDRCLLKGVRSLTFDSKVHTMPQLPYQSIAFANHGPDSDGAWAFTKDLSVPCTEESTDETIAKLSPLLELMMSVLEKALMSKEHTTHIAILACKAAGCDPKLIPTLEQLYNVDFMASTDDTGNASSGGNWKMETDGIGERICGGGSGNSGTGTAWGNGRAGGGGASGSETWGRRHDGGGVASHAFGGSQ
eukprot:gene19871-18997_t